MLGGALMVLLCWRMRDVWTDAARRRRLLVLGGASIVAVIGALTVPNALEWKSDSPYLDSVRGVVNYKEGSGAGRLVQYLSLIHISEPTRLLSISYAVFCLKKKTS